MKPMPRKGTETFVRAVIYIIDTDDETHAT